nr:MAG TPA: hypothetical protein [Caudoviricetes sp.]
MKKLSVIQKNNNPHAIYRNGDKGPGGGYHDYTVTEAGGNSVIALIRFQKGARNAPNVQVGVLDADLLEIVRDRLTAFNKGEFATRENACAITHIEEALMWMAKRADDRAERGVLGTYNK